MVSAIQTGGTAGTTVADAVKDLRRPVLRYCLGVAAGSPNLSDYCNDVCTRLGLTEPDEINNITEELVW